MRAFVALELPEAFADETAALSRALAEVCDGRFVDPENLHLTLAFLGEVGEAEARSAMAALDAACLGTGPVRLGATGLGTFGRASDATLWLGIQKDPQLMGLADRMREELAARDLSYDEKGFLPHVTLARRARLPRGGLGELAFPLPDVATRLTLFRSILGSDGARYKSLYTVELDARL
ncbi:RNA 2',3'-cyclic phosphodiesterase [Thermophilibacter provencensis]|uniref:RNA 2',3'-cyclic phosphodiesterase n=1 Tax=Thermophilibacter provencensis TaxID=1852386 RepID=A0ABT7V4Y7_9ACTN|nr:RNA 2',3'-cyclic phosphodiesterase [Thermophilibacter provencensis]MDM8271669.1 RNA 2',3'-cyclic phosphodiesterase [Thermophilibacter provencensis]